MAQTRKLVLLLPLLLAGLRAQDEPPSPQDLARHAQGLVQQARMLRESDSATKEMRAEAEKAIADFAAAMARGPGLSADHYVQASSPLLAEAPLAALQITEAGLEHHPDARFLWDHAGMARLQIAVSGRPSAEQVAELKRSEQAFRKALALAPDTFHAHLGIAQALSQLDEPAAALAELDLAMQDEQAKAAAPNAWLIRAGLLLRCGRTKEAVKVLTDPGLGDDLREPARVLLLRAHALGNDAAAATALITKLQTEAPGLATNLAAADALAYLGKKAEALKLLAQRPATAAGGAETDDVLLAQGAATMEAFWKATDISPKGPLRAAMTKALDHHFLVVDATAKPQPKETDVGSSPLLMSRLLAKAPATPAKAWGNRVLLILCIRAVREHKATPFEAQVAAMTKDMETPVEADVPAIAMAMRWAVGDPEVFGVLTGLRALDKLVPKAPPKK
jgi:hypothetical protein